MKEREKVEHLLMKFFLGRLTSAEERALMDWISAADNRDLESVLQKIWEKYPHEEPIFLKEESEAIYRSIVQRGRAQHNLVVRRSSHRWWYYSAATVFFLTALIFWRAETSRKSELAATQERVRKDVDPGGNRATLRLSNGKLISLDDSAPGFIGLEGGARVKKTTDGVLNYALEESNLSENTQTNVISTPRGGEYQLRMVDGTKVWLNAESSLEFSPVFDHKKRTVKLSGEAFFEVAKDASRPFTVVFENREISVLGTSFNVQAYPGLPQIRTTLLEGSVRYTNHKIGYQEFVKPGEQISEGQGLKPLIAKVDVQNFVSWKDGYFLFQDTPLEEVMFKVEKWYDVKVEFQGKIPQKTFTGKVSRYTKVSTLLDMLAFIGVKYQLFENKIVILG